MSETEPSSASSQLSFERAEFETPAASSLSCAFCRQPLRTEYWQLNQRTTCTACRAQVLGQLTTSRSPRRFLSALLCGAAAAAVGCLAWIVITRITGYEVGYVAIGVGYLVGKAVRKGAGGQGGTRYQALAVGLTYAAIALSSLPAIFEAVAASAARHSAAAHTAGAAAAHAAPSLAGFLWAWLTLFGIALASPFLGGTENFMGIVIIGIGLYEAWKLTRAVNIQVLGPFAVPAPAAHVAD